MPSWQASIKSCAWLRDKEAAALVWRLAVTGSFQVQLFHCNSPPPVINVERGIICMDVGMQQAQVAVVLPSAYACLRCLETSDSSLGGKTQTQGGGMAAGGRGEGNGGGDGGARIGDDLIAHLCKPDNSCQKAMVKPPHFNLCSSTEYYSVRICSLVSQGMDRVVSA